MRALLDDLTVLEHQDLIGARDGAQPVCNHEGGAAGAQTAQSFLDEVLTFRIQRRGRFVENQHPRIAQNGTGDRHPLTLAAGQLHAAFADDRVVLLRKALNELVRVRDFRHGHHFILRGSGLGEGDVLHHGAVEQEIVLHDHAQMTTILAQFELGHRRAVHFDLSLLRLGKRHDQRDHRAFAAAA